MTAGAHSTAMTTEELFRQHAQFVCRFLARLGVPAEHIPDALQEVFLVVHRQGGYRPGIAKPTSYLAGIALHAARKHRRRERVERARHSETGADQLAHASADPVQRLQVQQDLERLQRALDHLSEEHRTALVLVEIEGESCLSVAAALGVPVGTMYSRVHVARKKLQLALRWVDGQRPTPSRGRRLERTPSLSMFAWFGLDAVFRRSEAARLLRVAREQPPVIDVPEALLARHRELVQSGAELPSWAAQCVPQSATWFGVLSLGSVATVTSLTAASVVAALMIGGGKPRVVDGRSQPTAAEMTAVVAPASQPLAATSAAAVEPQPSAADPASATRTITTAVGVSNDALAARPRATGAENTSARSVVDPTTVAARPQPGDLRATRDATGASETPASSRADGTRTGVRDTARSQAAQAEPIARASGTDPRAGARARATAAAAAHAVNRAELAHTDPRAAERARARQASSRQDATEPAAHSVTRAELAHSDPRATHDEARADTAEPAAHVGTRADPHTPDRPQPTAAAPIRLPAPMPADYRPVDSLQEMRDVASAEHLLASDPARALRVVRSVRERFPDGYLREERAYVEVMALVKLQRAEEARAQADAFLRRYPDGPYSQRVRSAVPGSAR